ncbi:MAG: hypothetical protein BWX86_02076 [Verrucomicrobia bacterium ADurb.Bin122]|nr:MAG: hypothetical protein BWX86_02076 [Verrucomicrobia bacterium ADurb.Bin122]
MGFAFSEAVFGIDALPVFLCLPEGALDGGGQAGDRIFEDKVAGAVVQGGDGDLFADASGDEDERGVGAELAFVGECGEAVDGREVKIGQDEVGWGWGEGVAIRGNIVHVLELVGEAFGFDQGDDQLEGAAVVFEVNDAGRVRRGGGHVSIGVGLAEEGAG